MPVFIVEIHSKSTYGPFAYGSPGWLKSDLANGQLNLSELTLEADRPTRIAIKEVKPKK